QPQDRARDVEFLRPQPGHRVPDRQPEGLDREIGCALDRDQPAALLHEAAQRVNALLADPARVLRRQYARRPTVPDLARLLILEHDYIVLSAQVARPDL